MTDAEQNLCKAIAEEEGHHVSANGQYVIHATFECPWNVERYLTDPAESMRMLNALIEYYDDEVSFSTNSLAGLALGCMRYEEPTHSVGIQEAESVPIAVAEAFLAMLIEKREQSADNETTASPAKSFGDKERADNELTTEMP